MVQRGGEVTRLLEAWRGGDEAAVRDLFPLVYQELRRLAHSQRYRGRRHDSLVTTALVHEAYLKLVGAAEAPYENRGHFMAIAAKAMRQILVDQARKRMASKRGGDLERVELAEERISLAQPEAELVALDEALSELQELDPRMSRIVELRFFAGLSVAETAEACETSATTVKREWRKAKAFLRRRITEASSGE